MSIPSEEQLNAFRGIAIQQGYDSDEVSSFMNMAQAGATQKRTEADQAKTDELKMYEEKLKLQDQYGGTDSQPGSLTEIESRAITEGQAAISFDEATGTYKLTPQEQDPKIVEETEKVKQEVRLYESGGKKWDDLSDDARGLALDLGLSPSEDEGKSLTEAQLKIYAPSLGALRSISRAEEEIKNPAKMFGATTNLLPFEMDLTPWGRGLEADLFNAVDVILRLRTGAQAPDREIERYLKQKGPRLTDSKAIKERKLNELKTELTQSLKSIGVSDEEINQALSTGMSINNVVNNESTNNTDSLMNKYWK